MLIDHIAQVLLDIKYGIFRFFYLRRNDAFQNRPESLFLLRGSPARLTAQPIFYKACSYVFCILRVITNGMDIAASTGKCREQKTVFRRHDNPVSDARTNAVFIFAVAQSGFGKFNRTDGAEDILINFL